MRGRGARMKKKETIEIDKEETIEESRNIRY